MLADEVLTILRAHRLRGWLLGGLSPTQVLERLPPEHRSALMAAENPVIARREATKAVVLALEELVEAGLVRRGRLRLKNAIVDVYRLARRSRPPGPR